MKATLIRPGLLVSLKTSVRGGVTYEKIDLEPNHRTEEGTERARWETTRSIADAAEFKAAGVVRSKCRTLVSAACCPSSFGMLCPQANEDKLQDAVDEAQQLADKHNSTAQHSRVEVYVITGRIADSDQQAARAIGSEVRELIAAMEAGVRAADPAAIREAANRARAMAGMLSPDVQAKVTAAIGEVRSVARDIVRRVEKAGEQAASIVNGLRLEKLEGARFAVLDLDGDEEGVSVPVAGRSIEFDADVAPVSVKAASAPAIELGA